MDAVNEGKSNKTKVMYGLLLAGSLSAMALGYYLEHRAPFLGQMLWAHLSRDIGIAGVVGYILAITFERLSADEFRRLTEEERAAIKKDVFFYVLGHDLPQEIRDEISTQILKSLFIRRNLTLIFELEEIKAPDTGDSYMLTTCTMSYDIKNLTKVKQLFPLNSSVDKSPVTSLAGETKFVHLSVKGSEQPFDLDEKQLAKMCAENENEILLHPGPDKPIVVLPGRMTTVAITYQTVRFLRRGHLDFVFTTHTCELDLSVRVRNPNVKVFATAYANSELKEVDLKHRPSFGIYNWKIDRPLIAYQSISITWALEPAAAASAASNAPLLESRIAASDSAQPALAGTATSAAVAPDAAKMRAANPTPDGDAIGAEKSRTPNGKN